MKKIIFTTRPITEVLASFIAIEGEKIEEWMLDASTKGFYVNPNLSKIDNMCDFLMHERGQIFQTLLSINSIDNNKTSNFIHVVKYEDLLSKPDVVMSDIYSFLEMSKFEHDFYNIEKIENDPTVLLALPPLHDRCRCEVQTLPILSSPGVRDGRRIWRRSEDCCEFCEASANEFNKLEVQRLMLKGIDINAIPS